MTPSITNIAERRVEEPQASTDLSQAVSQIGELIEGAEDMRDLDAVARSLNALRAQLTTKQAELFAEGANRVKSGGQLMKIPTDQDATPDAQTAEVDQSLEADMAAAFPRDNVRKLIRIALATEQAEQDATNNPQIVDPASTLIEQTWFEEGDESPEMLVDLEGKYKSDLQDAA